MNQHLEGWKCGEDEPSGRESKISLETFHFISFYEQQWLARGLTIKYIRWHLDADKELCEPDIEIEFDTYRSFSRGYLEADPKFSAK